MLLVSSHGHVNTFEGFHGNELSNAMRSKAIMGDVVGTWQRRGEDRQTIAFCVDKTHAAELCAEFLAAGIVAEIVVDDTEDPDRERIVSAFDRYEIRVLVRVGVAQHAVLVEVADAVCRRPLRVVETP